MPTAEGRADAIAPVHLVLVHGTWGRGPPFLARRAPDRPAGWCRGDSSLARALGRGLDRRSVGHLSSDFRWSGANSFRERDLAARRLAEMIRESALHLPGHRQVIVAHSHGGNVALRTLQLLATEEPKCPPPEVVTLATPFIHLRDDGQRRESKALWSYLGIAAIVTLLYVSLLFRGHAQPFWVLTILIVPIFTKSYLLAPLSEWLLDLGETRRQSLAKAAGYDLVSADSPVLVLRGVEDEASMILMMGTIGVRLSDLFTGVIFVTMALAVLAFVILAAAAAATWIAGGGAGVERWLASSLGIPSQADQADALKRFWVGASVSLAAALVIPGVFKSAFGSELLLGSGRLSVTANSVPDVDGPITVITLERGAQGEFPLLHSLYDHPDCPEAIAAWLADRPSG